MSDEGQQLGRCEDGHRTVLFRADRGGCPVCEVKQWEADVAGALARFRDTVAGGGDFAEADEALREALARVREYAHPAAHTSGDGWVQVRVGRHRVRFTSKVSAVSKAGVKLHHLVQVETPAGWEPMGVRDESPRIVPAPPGLLSPRVRGES